MVRTLRMVAVWALVLAVATLLGLSSSARQGGAEALIGTTAPGGGNDALILLPTLDLESFQDAIASVRNSGGEVLQAYPPNALVVSLHPAQEPALRQQSVAARIERGVVDADSVGALGGQARLGAYIWNTAFRGVLDPTIPAPSGSPPDRQGPSFRLPPAQPPGGGMVAYAPTSNQTSEFMAGTIVASVVFVESSGGTGYCSPADGQTENWDLTRRNQVLSEVSAGLSFWTARADRPSPLTFMVDDRGPQPTSCEPINHPADPDEGKWIADVLKAMGRSSATPDNYYSEAQAYAASRRTALGADWGYLIFVVDSFNDSNGLFSDGYFAYAYLNGPFMVMTYDNDGWGIGYTNFVTAHETGHIFGALDEYASSGCSTADSFGYLNVSNASCNNGGITSDLSIMGEAGEQTQPSSDVSTSARGAIGWRNPAQENGQTVVDVVRTATDSLTPYSPDPTTDSTPSYSASAGNTSYPPAGPRRIGGYSYGTASPATVSKAASAEWRLDGGPFTSAGVAPNDGIFNEESDPYTFTPQSPVANGAHTFRTRSINNFGHTSSIASDPLTIAAPQPDGDGDTVPDATDNCPAISNPTQSDVDLDTYGDVCDSDADGDGFPNTKENNHNSDWLNVKCNNATNDDSGDDSKVNDNCPPRGTAESGSQCDNALDDDSDGKVNDGCPLAGTRSEGSFIEVCDGLDNDGDTQVDEDFPDTNPGGPRDCMDSAVDTDGDTVVNTTDTDDDSDGDADPAFNDGFSDSVEAWTGTDSLDACPDTTNDDAWAPDMNNNRTVNLLDVLLFPPTLGSTYGGTQPLDRNYNRRFDLNASKIIDLLDVLLMPPHMGLGKTCTN